MNEHRIKSIVKNLADINSLNFFDDICLSLSNVIDADFVFIATLNKDHSAATTISNASKGTITENFTYCLTQTPCEKLIQTGICSHSNNIQALYPKDQLLIDMGVEGYVGIPLKNTENKTIAILVALFQERITDTNEIETLFLLFSGLIEKELHKKSFSEKLELTNKIIENSHEAIVICDKDSNILYTNKAFTHITGYSANDALGKNPKILKSGHHGITFYRNMWQSIENDGHWQGEIWNKHKTGSIIIEWLSISVIYDQHQQPSHYVSFFSDITEQNKAKDQIRRHINFDSLTKLPNKKMFFERVEQELSINKTPEQPNLSGVFVMDLDLFKNINNTYGHKFGDELLTEIAKRLKSLVRNTDIVARTSGDNFAIFVKNFTNEQNAKHIAHNISKAFQAPFQINDISTSCTLSIGIALSPHDATNADNLFKKAEQAMFNAKDNGRNSYSFFSPHMEEESIKSHQLKNDLEIALSKDNLDVVFQPIVSLKNASVPKFEVLVRWNNNGTWISPVEFIPVAENFGLITQVGEVVLRKSCLQLKKLKEAGFNHIVFNVNRSIYEFPRDINNHDLWLNTIAEYGLSPSDICFELTESVLAPDNDNNINVLKKLQQAGCQIALDDFGTGYSSLSYLRRFSINVLKIDRSFIKEITTNPDDKILVTAIISMAKALGIEVVAEGVELKAEVELLTELKCDYIQGYYYSKPLPADEIIKFLTTFTFE